MLSGYQETGALMWWFPFLQGPTDWIGKEVTPGQIGLINHGGLPKILTRPGRYPGFPLRNWWARTWSGTCGCTFCKLLVWDSGN